MMLLKCKKRIRMDYRDFFTDRQRSQIENMDIKDRVELIRHVFWNNETFDESYRTLGLEDMGATPENVEYFLKGATAMFDHAQLTAANHWHGDEGVNRQCERENEFLLQVMETAFEYVNPDKMAVWRKLKEDLS